MSMSRRFSLLLLALAALALLAPAPAPAAKRRAPVITFVSPMRVKVGDTLTIRGRNFSSRRSRNTVIFLAPNGRTAFAKPRGASSRKLVVRVPGAVARLMSRRDGRSVPTRFKLRVLTSRFGRFTVRRLSPVILPVGFSDAIGGAPGGNSVLPPPGVCGTGSDYDGDLLGNQTEVDYRTDPCLKDTDLDGVEDGYEFQSAVDLGHYPGSPPLPYPGKRPYPNPLDSSDRLIDFDGDGMKLGEEYLMWVRFAGDGVPRGGRPTTLFNLLYSEGLKTSQNVPVPGDARTAWALDQNEDGRLHDGERDAEGDGLGNWDEARGQMTEAWWPAVHNGEDQPKESKYPEINFLDNADVGGDIFADYDADGDGVRDGDDDYDHDGLTNQFEVRRPGDWYTDAWTVIPPADPDSPPTFGPGPNSWAYTNPFNPCKPYDSERCHEYVPVGYYNDDEVPPIGPSPPPGYPGSAPATPDG
jgi:hypothetical protein